MRIGKLIWNSRKLVFLFFIIGIVVESSPAQSKYKSKPWSVGQWATYQITRNKKEMSVKYSLTGMEKLEGKTYYWLECRTVYQAETTISRMLLGQGEVLPKEVVIKNGNEPAMTMRAMLQKGLKPQIRKLPSHTDMEINKGYIGTEEVSVPAGKFKTIHSKLSPTVENESGEIWVSGQIPVLGTVKSSEYEGANKTRMILTGFGKSGAKTEITEKPIEGELPKPLIKKN